MTENSGLYNSFVNGAIIHDCSPCQEVAEKCTECMKCVNECGFLERYGSPKKIAGAFSGGDSECLRYSFECSLCGLCDSVCPLGVKTSEFLLQMRRDAVSQGIAPFKEHSTILSYERKGTSKLFTYYSLPKDCDTVFFPGCAFTGSRPESTMTVLDMLRKKAPSTGIVLDCCCKPSHDLGRVDYFNSMFGEMRAFLLESGIKKLIVACPNCYKVFKTYGSPIEVITVYEVLSEHSSDYLASPPMNRNVTIHDPCVLRDCPGVQDSVRKIAENSGCSISEMKHCREKTLCCGEGGSVGFIDQELADSWKIRRLREAGKNHVITYCAGCSSTLGKMTGTSHVIDVLIDPESALSCKARVSKAPFTYINRLLVKRRLKRNDISPITRERDFNPDNGKKSKGLKAIGILTLLVAAVLLLRYSGISANISHDSIKNWVSSWGMLAPVIYILVYSIAPSFFVPALPITIAGGILFGPYLGVAYTITGATMGSCLPFLIARYAAREWVSGLIKNPKWKKLDEDVEKNGWKIVAFTRLIPVFPYNLLNYALGLTKIGFLEYAVTSFICMLPACIGFIVFSSSLPELVRGKLSPGLLVGIVIILLVSFIPAGWRRFTSRKMMAEADEGNDSE